MRLSLVEAENEITEQLCHRYATGIPVGTVLMLSLTILVIVCLGPTAKNMTNSMHRFVFILTNTFSSKFLRNYRFPIKIKARFFQYKTKTYEKM